MLLHKNTVLTFWNLLWSKNNYFLTALITLYSNSFTDQDEPLFVALYYSPLQPQWTW